MTAPVRLRSPRCRRRRPSGGAQRRGDRCPL